MKRQTKTNQILAEFEMAMNGKKGKRMTTEDLVGLLEAVNGNIALEECRVKLANGIVIALEDKKKTVQIARLERIDDL